MFGIEGVRWLNPALTSARYPALYQLLVGRRRSQPGYFQKAEWASEPLAVDVEVSAESMASRLTAGFLKAQSDEWLMRFMSYVAKSSIYAFHSIAIVRLESGEHVVPKGKDGQPNAYLPPKDGSVELNGLPMVKASLLTKQDVVDFLQDDLDLGPPDLADFALTRILPKYRKAEKEVSVSRWKKDFRIVVTGLATDSYEKKGRLLEAIRTTAFLIGVLSSNRDDLKLVKPSQLYLSSPEVDEYFAGDETFYITPPDFYEQGDPEALASMGVSRTPRVARRTKATFAERRKTARQNRGAACKTPANAKTRSLILQSPVCRLYWRLLSKNRGINELAFLNSGTNCSFLNIRCRGESPRFRIRQKIFQKKAGRRKRARRKQSKLLFLRRVHVATERSGVGAAGAGVRRRAPSEAVKRRTKPRVTPNSPR